MAFNRDVAAALQIEARPQDVFIKGWNRLEGIPRTVDFERALRAEARDALWFLTRQWQFGELQGEDAASPVDVRTLLRCAPLTGYAARDQAAVPYDPAVPLETRVESEPLPADLTLHAQVTRYFFLLLADQANLAAIKDLYLDPAAYQLTEAAVAGYLDDDARRTLLLAREQLLDATMLLAEIAGGNHATRVDAFPGLTATERAALKQAGTDLLAYRRRLYYEPEAPAQYAWTPRQLEYQFGCTAEGPGSPRTRLVADQYDQGRLDWFAFDVGPAPVPGPGGGPPPQPPPGDERLLSFLPAPVSFGGMPSHRYWEFESRKTEFADINANTTDVAKLLLTEFALVYGNDWCVIPYVVPVGSLCEAAGMLVVDDFGETSLLPAAGGGPGDQWQRWSMFALTRRAPGQAADVRLLVPPCLPKSMEGPPLEQVLFLRDEMANMAWAVEKMVPSALGTGSDGYEVAREEFPPPAPPVLHETPALARYTLGNDVPANWHPLLPVHVPGSSRSVLLQRARMPGAARPILGRVIAGPSPHYLNEEEVPRGGKMVRRSFQRARWVGGTTFLWIGRKVTAGRGEGNSGLAFDQVTELKKKEEQEG